MLQPRSLTRYSRSIRIALLSALLLAAGVALTLIAQQLFADQAGADGHSSGTTVRISAIKSDAGDVRVALQPHDGEGWGERLHPQLNTLGADAPTNRWLNSSPLELAVSVHIGDDVADVPASIENDATEPGVGEPVADERQLLCVIAHGHVNDPFWQQVRGFMYQSTTLLNSHVRFHSSPDGASQAAAIAQCSADGAAAIAATLANPDAVTDALLAAKEAGARIVTFNSGASHAQAAGSELHIALDDEAAGRFIGERLNEQGITGAVACLIHERQNVGLEERCEGLEATYAGGEVREINLPTADDAEALQQRLRELLLAEGDDANDVLVALSAGTSVAALKEANAIEADGPVLEGKGLVAMGYSLERGTHRRARTRAGLESLDLLGVADASEAQGWFIVSALTYVANFPLTPVFVEQPTIMLITPWNLNLSGLQTVSFAELQASDQAYRAILAEAAKVEPIVIDPSSLANTRWRLAALGDADAPADAVGDATAEFTAAELTGWTGCNSYSARYSVQGSELRFDDLSWTEAGCATDALFQQEQRMQDSLANLERFEVSGQRLTLYSQDGQVLVFDRVKE